MRNLDAQLPTCDQQITLRGSTEQEAYLYRPQLICGHNFAEEQNRITLYQRAEMQKDRYFEGREWIMLATLRGMHL